MIKTLNILFISINNIWRYSNTGLDQLAGYLRKEGYTININYYHNKESMQDIIDDIEDDYNIICFSVHSANYLKCCQISEHIKKTMSKTIVVWGGYFPTMYYREILEEKRQVDYLVLGDGEVPTAQLLEAISKGEKEISIPSVVSYTDSKNKKASYNTHIKHLPAFDYFEKDTPARNRRKIYCLQTKNNVCTGKCSFCTERKGKVIHKDIELIIDEVKYVVENFGVNQIFFTDDNIMDPNDDETKRFIRALCMRIKTLNYKIAIQCYIKANSFKDCEEDHELLQLMSSVGFATMFVGIEAGNQKDLKLYNKLTTVEQNINIINMLRKNNIAPIIGFIHFNPYSTLETLKENFKFLLEIEAGNLFQYAATIISLQRYTPLYNYVKRDNLLKTSYDYMNNMDYNFQNEEVQKLVDFVMTDLRPRILNLDMEIDTLIQTYAECERINPEVKKYKIPIYELKKKYMVKIKEYFSWLYIDNDLEKCKCEANGFLTYFEEEQEHLMKYYWDIVKMMIV